MPFLLCGAMPDGTIQKRPAQGRTAQGRTVQGRPAADRPARPQPHDAEQTRQDIIDAAWAEFVQHGLSGASINTIAARTRTTKPMIYYYFGSKEGLYAAVMEKAYGGIRDVEQGLRLDHLPPVDALRRLVEATFDYHADYPDFVRLISTENIHHARHIQASPAIAERNAAVIGIVRALLDRGTADGSFRARIDPVDLHLLISSICFHRVSNRYTWGVIFGCDMQAPAIAAAHRRMASEAVLAYVAPAASGTTNGPAGGEPGGRSPSPPPRGTPIEGPEPATR